MQLMLEGALRLSEGFAEHVKEDAVKKIIYISHNILYSNKANIN